MRDVDFSPDGSWFAVVATGFVPRPAGSAAVSRPGIGAIDPTSGLALPWNPTKDRGVGGKDPYVTSQGLWVGSDTTHIGRETHARIALMPR
jgi:hypothetical protein